MTTESKTYGTITLSAVALPIAPRFCWRNAEGGRVSRYFVCFGEALRYAPK